MSESTIAIQSGPVMDITPSTTPEQLPFFLTVKQVAAWTGWSESTIKRKIRSEGLPAIPASDSKNSRQYRIPKEAFLDWFITEATNRKEKFQPKPDKAARLKVVK